MWIWLAHRHEAPLMRCCFRRSAPLISASQPYSQASANTARPLDMGWCIMRYACLLPQLSPGTHSSLTTVGGLRLSRPECLVLRRGGLPVQIRSPRQALTGHTRPVSATWCEGPDFGTDRHTNLHIKTPRRDAVQNNTSPWVVAEVG